MIVVYLRHAREHQVRDAVWYSGPYGSLADAEAARQSAITDRPVRMGPNGPIDSVDVVVTIATIVTHRLQWDGRWKFVQLVSTDRLRELLCSAGTMSGLRPSGECL